VNYLLSYKTQKNQHCSLNQLADTYFDETKDTKNNLSDKKQQGKYDYHLKETIGYKDINELYKYDLITEKTSDLTKKLQDKLEKKGLSANTINGIMTLGRAIFNYAIKTNKVDILNPFRDIEKLSSDDKREKSLSREELDMLLNEVEDNKNIYDFVKLAIMTGVRLKGVLAIQRKHIDFTSKSIILQDFKKKKGKSVIITYKGYFDDKSKDYLQKLTKGLKPNDFVVGGDKEAIKSKYIQDRLQPTINDLFNDGLEKDDRKHRAVIHTIRHTFGALLVQSGVPLYNVQKLMNHSSIEITERYSHLKPDGLINDIEGLFS